MRIHSMRSQSGMVLVVAIVLLLLAGVLTLFALKVGMFEQRSTGNDMRSKVVSDVAEAGLAQGFEYLMRQHKDVLEDPDNWIPCAAISRARLRRRWPISATSASRSRSSTAGSDWARSNTA